ATRPGRRGPRRARPGRGTAPPTQPRPWPTWPRPGRPRSRARPNTRAWAPRARAGAAGIRAAPDDGVAPTLPAPVLAAVVTAAAEHGLGVTAHVGGAAEAAKAPAARGGGLAPRPFDPAGLPDPLVDALAEAMVAVPTLHIDPSA